MYKLNIGKTYATVLKAFVAGQLYTAEQLGSVLKDTDESGEPYFVEVDAPVPSPLGNPVSPSEAIPADAVSDTPSPDLTSVAGQADAPKVTNKTTIKIGKKASLDQSEGDDPKGTVTI